MESKNNRSAHGAFGLARQYATCKQIFEIETERIFNRNWICVGHASTLPDTGLQPIEHENHNLFVARHNSVVRVFRNFCRHRGSQLVTAENCQSLGQRIQCPYHAWTYARDGSLLSAPNMDGVEGFSCDDFGLLEIPSEIVGGFIWICLEPKNTAQDFLAVLDDQFENWGTSELAVTNTLSYEVAANWKLIFQNFSECYHCPSVHPILNRLTPYKDSSNDVISGPILGGPMQLADDAQTMSMDGKLVGNPLPGLNTEQHRSVNYFTICPTIFFSTHPDYVLIHRLSRLAIDRTLVVCEFLFHPNSIANSDFDTGRAVEFWDITNRQDWKVCELAQAGMNDPAYSPGPYSNLESVVAAFDQYYLEVMSDENHG